jgi:hypothetical protein
MAMKKVTASVVGLTIALLVLRPGILFAAAAPSPAPSGDYITGRVTLGRSNPARSIWVMVYDGASLKGRSLTGDDGRYYIGGLEEKKYTIVVRRQTSGNNLVSQNVSLPHDRVHNIGLP